MTRVASRVMPRRLVARAANLLPRPVTDRALSLATRYQDRATVTVPRARRVLAVVAHPDDETIAFGATMRQLRERGAAVRLLWATSGEGAWIDLPADELGRRRENEGDVAAATLDVVDTRWLRLPDGSLAEHLDVLTDHVRDETRRLDPDLVLTLWPGDAHPDHRAVARATATAVAALAPTTPVWGGEVWSPAPADVVVDVSDQWHHKVAALEAHETARTEWDTRALLGLGRYRSVHGLRGRGHAEAFVAAPAAEFLAFADALDAARDARG